MLSMFDSNIGNDSSPIAMAIEQATDPMLMHADWTRNLDICDMINEAGEGQISATKMLRKQLRSDNPKTVKLALELTDACVKNCTSRFHFAVANKAFLGDVIVLAEGKRGWEIRDEALKLIQQWHISFQEKRDELPAFHEAYASLKTKGLPFPALEQSAPVFTPPPAMFDEDPPAPTNTQPVSSSTNNSNVQDGDSGGTGSGAQDDLAKLKDDLGALKEKIMLCREMLPESPGIEHDETLAEVIGFLEACQPRMVDLVEAGMMGMLDEELLSIALQVNDDLIKTLEAEKNGTPLPAEPSSEGGGGGSLLDLEPSQNGEEEEELEGRRKGKNRQRSRSPANTSGVKTIVGTQEDIFSNLATPQVVPARSTGRFEEPTAPAQPVQVVSDPFGDISSTAGASSTIKPPTSAFDNLSIFDQNPNSAQPVQMAPSFDPFEQSSPEPSTSAFDQPSGSNGFDQPSSSFNTFDQTSTNSNNTDPQPTSPSEEAAAPAASTTNLQKAYNPFDFDEASSYIAPSSEQVISSDLPSPPLDSTLPPPANSDGETSET